MRRRPIYATAQTVEIHCPHCGMTIPDPDEASEFWTMDQVRALAGEGRNCNSCDEPISMSMPSRVLLDPKQHEASS